MNLDEIETVTFDSYTTLVDIDYQEAALAEHVDGLDDPPSVSRVWRARNMMYTVIANDIDAYTPFYEILKLSLRFALETYGYDVSDEVLETIRREVYKNNLSIFPDVRPGMERIADEGYEMYVISNGDPEMLQEMLEQAEIADLLEDAISADEIERYKPESEIYRHGAARTGTPINRILHVSGGTMRDVWGAKHAGMRTVWLDRPEKNYPREFLGEEPDLVLPDIESLAETLER